MLDDTHVALVTVRSRRTEFVNFNLVPTYAEFYIEVLDGKEPVKGARAWVESAKPKPVFTDEKGRCYLQVPRGQQMIWIEARGMKIPRPMAVFKTDAHEMAINLVWERRVDDASRALEKKKPS